MKVAPFEKQNNDYQSMMLESYLGKHLEFYENTIAKFERNQVFDFRIEDFYWGDFRDHIDHAGGIVFLFAPTYKGGYEKIYQRVEEVFEYEHPQYEIFDSDNAGEVYQKILSQQQAVIYSDRIFEELKPCIQGVINMPGNKKDIYLYSSVESKKHVLLNQENLLEKTYEILASDFNFEVSTKVDVVECKASVIAHYKHLFMSNRVDYSTGAEDLGLLFFAGRKLFGFASFSTFLGTGAKDSILMVSDFVVSSKIRRLSKLVIYLLKSIDIKRLLARRFKMSYKSIQTSVYTDKPVSMKYRGVFDLLRREKGKLIYVGEFTEKSKEELVKEWMRKHCKR